MGVYLKTIKKLIKGMEVKTGLILLLTRREFYSDKHDKKITVLSLRHGNKKSNVIYSSANEGLFLKHLAELFKLDGQELTRVLLTTNINRKERGG